jgi:hypothetical protein
MNKKQIFRRGDLVKIAPLPPGSIHEDTHGQDGIVIASYAQKYGGGDRGYKQYTLFLKDHGEVSWYDEGELTFVRNDPVLLQKWKRADLEQAKKNSDLKWIHRNWRKIQKSTSSTTVLTLLEFIGFQTSFHRNGEFFVLFNDWRMMFPFVDKLMTAKVVEDLKGPDGEVSDLADELFKKLQNTIK